MPTSDIKPAQPEKLSADTLKTKEAKQEEFTCKLELYKIVRTQIEHEDELVNHRKTWFFLSQTIIFTAYFTLLTTMFLNYDKFQAFDLPGKSLLVVMSFLVFSLTGFILVVFSFKSIYNASQAIIHLRKFWFTTYPGEGEPGQDNEVNYTCPDTVRKNLSSTKELPDISFVDTELKHHNFFSIVLRVIKIGTFSKNASLGTPFIILMIWLVIIVTEIIYIFIEFNK